MIILRPSWPEMYCNLTMGLPSQEPQGLAKDRFVRSVLFFLVPLLAFHLKQHLYKSTTCLFLLSISIGFLLLPLILVLLAMFWTYRQAVRLILSRRPGYVSLMDGTDAYWTLEDKECRGIINILSYVEYQPKEKEGAADLLTIIRATLQSRILTDPKLFKMSCRRQNSKSGYCYWERRQTDIDEHIRWFEPETNDEEGLQDFISSYSNNPLPQDNTTFWEILVGKKCIYKEKRAVYPVLFRVHHAIGDGIALVSMFQNSLVDEGKNGIQAPPLQKIKFKKEVSKYLTKDISRLEKIFNKVSEAIEKPLGRRTSLIKIQNDFKQINRHFIYRVHGLMEKISVLMFMPIVLSTQYFYGVDKNILHGKICSGEKHLCWKSGDNLLGKIKKIKEEMKCHFTDVILIAISNSLETHFNKFGKAPADITVVIPSRLPREEVINGMNTPTNSFTIGMMKLPVANRHKLQGICRATRKLRTEPHFLVNYWLLKVACTYIPLPVIGRFLRSEQATIVMSNIPGPETVSSIDGNPIHDLVFWVPNRELTGVGFSILSYAGKLNFGLHIDQALIPSKLDAQAIVNDIVETIDKMYQSVK